MPGLSPRPHACDPNLAAKLTQASNADQGYLMIEKTVLGSRSSCAAHAWPNQARGAELPDGSSSRKSDAQISFLRDHHSSPQVPRSTKLPAHSSLPPMSAPCQRSSRQSMPIGHALGNGLAQHIFRPPSRRSPLVCIPSLSRRAAGLKMLCVMLHSLAGQGNSENCPFANYFCVISGENPFLSTSIALCVF